MLWCHLRFAAQVRKPPQFETSAAMARAFLSSYSDEEIIASTGLVRMVFIMIYVKYCGFGTPINK